MTNWVYIEEQDEKLSIKGHKASSDLSNNGHEITFDIDKITLNKGGDMEIAVKNLNEK